MKNKDLNYKAPSIDTIEVNVEAGIADSGGNAPSFSAEHGAVSFGDDNVYDI